MAQKFHIKRGDQVVVIAGSQKGKSGKILEVLPRSSAPSLEGVAMIKRHLKKSRNIRTAPSPNARVPCISQT